MKKILFAVLALAGLAACSTDEVVSRPQGAAIGFDSFVDHTTRAAEDLTFANLADFGVYGTVAKGTDKALIFTNTTVTKADGVFTYSPVQYWVADATYTFTAFAPATAAKWAYAPANVKDAYNGVLSFNNASAKGEQDLLFASAERTIGTITSTPDKVGFTFGHLLSKVAFNYKNNFTDGNITLNVYDVQVTNAAAEGTIEVANGVTGNWTATGNYLRTFGLNYADATNLLTNGGGTITTEHFYFIPAQREYNVKFKVDVIQAGVRLQTYQHNVTANINFEKGKSYSINAVLTPDNVNPAEQLYPIEFTVVKVEDWTNADVALAAVTVADAASLEAAVANGGAIRLTEDITLPTEGLSVAANASIDLNGYTLTVLESNFVNNANLTISNGTISGSNTQVGRRAIVNKGNLTMNNVKVAQVYEAGGSAINNDGSTAVAILNNVTVAAENMAVSNKNGANMTINGGSFVGNGKGLSYSICNQLGSTMVIKGAYVEGGHGAVSSTESSVTTINSGVLKGINYYAIYCSSNGEAYYNEAEVTLNGGVRNTCIEGEGIIQTL